MPFLPGHTPRGDGADCVNPGSSVSGNLSLSDDMERNTHNPEEVARAKATWYDALLDRYTRIAESLYKWEFGEPFEEMLKMTHNEIPEKYLMNHGKCCVFEFLGSLWITPCTMRKINIYGNMEEWSPVVPSTSDVSAKINNLRLNHENSVLIFNNSHGTTDLPMISQLCNEFVDNMITMNQLQLLARSPYVLRVASSGNQKLDKANLLTAKNYYLSLSEGNPVIYIDESLGDSLKNIIERTDTNIDPSLFELYDRWECLLLETIGLECVPITKRAQQSVSEVESNQQKIFIVKNDKLQMRQKAVDEINAMWSSADVTVTDVLEVHEEEQLEEQEDLMVEEPEENSDSKEDETND